MNRDAETGRFVQNVNTWKVRKKTDGTKVYYCYLNDELLFFTDDESVRGRNWAKLADGYSATRINGEEVSAHRFISKPNGEELVDHINRNKKDNRRCNLRNTDKSINAFNSKKKTTNTSGVVGVWYRNDTKKWAAEIKKNGKKFALGCFETKHDAIIARKTAERILYDGC